VSAPAGPPRPSGLRLAAGWLILLCAGAAALFGFLQLRSVLAAERHGAAALRNALMILGGAGGGIAVGITFLIWEFTVRLGRRSK
jgi:hypothetical protein